MCSKRLQSVRIARVSGLFRSDLDGRTGALLTLTLAAAWAATCAGDVGACGIHGATRALVGCARAGPDVITCPLGGGNRTVRLALLPALIAAPAAADRTALCLGLSAVEGAAWSARYDDTQPLVAATVNATCWDAGEEACSVEAQAPAELWELPPARATPDEQAFWSCASCGAAVLRELRAGPAPVRAPWLRDGLRNCSHLRTLRLDNLDLGAETLVLPPLINLHTLEISGLLYLPPEIFQATPSLETLILRRCFLNGLPSGLSTARHLRSLEVNENQGYAFRVREGELSALEKLEALRITRASTVDASTLEALPPLPRLRLLDLSRTNVRFSPSDDPTSPFDKFPELEELRLSRNRMTHFGESFLRARQLRIVDLSRNSFEDWPTVADAAIQSLDLSNNGLVTVKNLGEFNTTVGRLDLSMNNIAQWDDPDVFSKQNDTDVENSTKTEADNGSWVEEVDLSLNLIVALTEPMMASLSDVKQVVLHGNELDCADCNTPKWAHWVLESGRVVDADALRCAAPPEDAGRPLAEAHAFLSACAPPGGGRRTLALVVALPLFGSFALLALAVALLAFRYRAEIAYTLHLFRIRQAHADDTGQHYLYDAFVCYSGSDRAWVVQTLAPLLEAPPARYRLCLHDRDFPLGSLIVDNIVRAIERSRRVVVVLSAHFVTSKWCKWELDMANHRSFEDSRGFLILIQLGRLERRALPRHLRFLMDTRTYLEWPHVAQAALEATTPLGEAAGAAARRRLREALGPSLRERTGSQHRPRSLPQAAGRPAIQDSPDRLGSENLERGYAIQDCADRLVHAIQDSADRLGSENLERGHAIQASADRLGSENLERGHAIQDSADRLGSENLERRHAIQDSADRLGSENLERENTILKGPTEDTSNTY